MWVLPGRKGKWYGRRCALEEWEEMEERERVREGEKGESE
jgi:hypothetical protein